MKKEIATGSVISAGRGTICLALSAPNARKLRNARIARGLSKIARTAGEEVARYIHCLGINSSD
jgi:hypothetical protein